jgi:hypothetical protein
MSLQPRFLLYSILLACLLAGCVTPPRSEFSTFAQAGSGYAVAVDRLLLAAGTAQVDSSSWSMVAEKEDTGMDEASYNKVNQEDLARLHEIERLRLHAQLLGQYFGMLEALATSDSPQKTKDAIEGIIKDLKDLKLKPPQGAEALPVLGELAADLAIRKALYEELKKRKETIRAELFIQEQLVKELRNQITGALNRQKQMQEYTLVVKPIVGKEPLTSPEKWVSTRQKVVYMAVTVEELGKASQSATKLREAFEGLISGEVTIGRLNALISDIEGLLAIAKTIKP